jgi:hypothetical protein
MVDPDGLPLEAAIERAVGPLEPLFAAEKAAVAYRPRLLPGTWRPPDPEHMRINGVARFRRAAAATTARQSDSKAGR